MFEFRCPDGHLNEKFIESSVRQIDCDICSQQATRIVSSVRPLLEVVSGHFPGATMKWARDRQKKIKAERRETELHGPAEPN